MGEVWFSFFSYVSFHASVLYTCFSMHTAIRVLSTLFLIFLFYLHFFAVSEKSSVIGKRINSYTVTLGLSV